MARPTVLNALNTDTWWIAPGLHDENDRVVTWLVCGGLNESGDSRYIGEFESKTLAKHVVKLHNQALRRSPILRNR